MVIHIFEPLTWMEHIFRRISVNIVFPNISVLKGALAILINQHSNEDYYWIAFCGIFSQLPPTVASLFLSISTYVNKFLKI